jgi:hypothetical protein
MNIVKQNMLMTSELIKIMKLLEEKGIEAISFKGPVLSQMVYGNITLRQYCDLDILVASVDLEKASRILLKSNYKEIYELEEYQKEKLKDVVHDITMINIKNGINIELHWTLSSGEFFIDLEKLDYKSDIKKYELSNSNINIFSNEKLFIYLCIHGYKHLWERIEWLVDIYYMIEKKNIDLEKVVQLSRTVDSERIVLSTLIICQKMFNLKLKIKDNLFQDKKMVSKTLGFYQKLIKSYTSTNNSNNNRKVSSNQFFLLKSFDNRLKYIKSFFIPTQKDLEIIKLPNFLYYLYYVVRPFNIIIRYFKG